MSPEHYETCNGSLSVQILNFIKWINKGEPVFIKHDYDGFSNKDLNKTIRWRVDHLPFQRTKRDYFFNNELN